MVCVVAEFRMLFELPRYRAGPLHLVIYNNLASVGLLPTIGHRWQIAGMTNIGNQ